MMTINEFFELFLKELEEHPAMRAYHTFLNDERYFEFRKAYFLQQLQYVSDQIQDKNATIWDCGCGYGTTALFLAMNGYRVYGTTLEYYFDEIEKRKKYWKQYGNSDLFEVDYADVFDNSLNDNSYDYIIIQKTLHHIEPLQEALSIFHRVVKPDGKVIVLEENGNNLIHSLKLFLKRGNKRIVSYWDERLQKQIWTGNENVRGWKKWKREFEKAGFVSETTGPEYIRFSYHPIFNRKCSAEEMIAKDSTIKRHWLRKYSFFGINFSMKPCK
ncbi:MAG: class I SAM-dependent methyltransferase [Bacteroidales bacterium]|nr:class I SAM-dependent methyltransferase [Bacteroidales bacterium]